MISQASFAFQSIEAALSVIVNNLAQVGAVMCGAPQASLIKARAVGVWEYGGMGYIWGSVWGEHCTPLNGGCSGTHCEPIDVLM